MAAKVKYTLLTVVQTIENSRECCWHKKPPAEILLWEGYIPWNGIVELMEISPKLFVRIVCFRSHFIKLERSSTLQFYAVLRKQKSSIPRYFCHGFMTACGAGQWGREC